MTLPQRSTSISQWTSPSERAADITVWPAHSRGQDSEIDRLMRGRLSLAIDCGAATVSLRPTAAEARALIEVLEWALSAEQVPA